MSKTNKENTEENKKSKEPKVKKELTRKGRITRFVCGFILLDLTLIVIMSYIWSIIAIPGLDIATIVFNLKVPVGGTEIGSYLDIILIDTIGAIVLTSLLTFLGTFIVKHHAKRKERDFKFNHRRYLKWTGILLAISVLVVLTLYNLPGYIYHQISKTTIYEDYYIEPENAKFEFPEEKRNLVYIFLESMENSYMDESHGGLSSDNYIPLLTDLALENTNFKSKESIIPTGPRCTVATNWTIAAYVAQTSGVPLSIPIRRNAMSNGYTTFLPGLYTMQQILTDEGYNQTLVMGSRKDFSGLDIYVETHGNTKIKDYFYARNNGLLPRKDYYVWWGMEDKRVFDMAKNEINELSAKDEPFAVTLMTMDTHRVDGYKCKLCEDIYDEQMANVLRCSEKQILDLINWLKEKDYYDNTTIVVIGDHPTMDGDFIRGLNSYNSKYIRTQYFTIINPAKEYSADADRLFTTMDVFPTVLSALGVTIEGDRLGLGTDLFSNTPTLYEELGFDQLNNELDKRSIYYEDYLLLDGNKEEYWKKYNSKK